MTKKMLKNYIKIAWRNIINSKFYTAINIIGLTTGLIVGILVLLWVQDELSYDQFHTNAGQLYKVNSQLAFGNNTQIWGSVQGPIATYSLKEVPGVVNAARIIYNGDNAVFKYGDRSLGIGKYGNYYVDPSLFKMLDIKFIKGNANIFFDNDRSIIITETTAKKYFGNNNPIGKIITADNINNFTVSGLVKDMPDNSSIKFDMLFSIELRKKQYDAKGYWKSMDSDWGDYYADTYLMLKPGTSLKQVQDKLTLIHVKNHKGVKLSSGHYLLQPITKMHLYSADGTETGAQTVRIFLIIAILILLIACINYINLSTARAMLRYKEVSIRKIIGADKLQLFMQFIVETALFFTMALSIAFLVIAFLMPYYDQLAGKNLKFNMLDPAIWRVVSITVFGTVLASGVYPAMLLSSFKPVSALKGKLSIGVRNTTFRKILVVCQFTFSVGLIIGTFIINKQLQYVHEHQLGYDKAHVFSFNMREMYKNYEGIRAELLNHPAIKDVASGDDNIINIDNSTGDTDWEGKPKNLEFLIHPLSMDEKYCKLFKLIFAAGENFRGEKADSAHYILNETAVRAAGIKYPIGKRFSLHNNQGIIIGVVKDFHFASLRKKIEPAIFTYRQVCSSMFIKTTAKNAPNALAVVQAIYKKYNPGFPFEYNFMDDVFDTMYKSDARSSQLFSIFTVVAIVISCLGLFGLATYTAHVKAKEIGIRKVLGASIASITAMLSKDFLKLVIIAIIIATPIAWYAMDKWLQNFVYRIDMQWWVFVLSGLVAIIIAFITIGSQAIKAAIANPVKSLRSE